MTNLRSLPIFLVLSLLPNWSFCSSDCSIEIPREHNKKTILLDVFHWKQPKPGAGQTTTQVGHGKNVALECANGFNDDRLGQEANSQYTFTCQNGLFNRTYQYEDLLCRSDFHKNNIITDVGAFGLNSKIMKCNEPNWKVYQVKVLKPDKTTKHLYTVCIDTKTMTPKYSFKPKKDTQPPLTNFHRQQDVWGFDKYGENTEEKMKLSQGYTQKAQKRRLTKIFPNIQNSNREYPYYFNRGHLVAFADFSEHDEQMATVQYLNAAPQWDVLNQNQWSLVEQESRAMTRNNPSEWEVYTGTYGNIPTTRGPLTLSALFHPDGRFKKALLYVPMLYWKLVYNTKDQTKSRAFVGVNNPEYKLDTQIPKTYIICTPIKRKGKDFDGDENYGFVYECPVNQFLDEMRSEKIVK